MIRRVPVVATLVVLLAVAVMIQLGFWQLDRLAEKEAMIARYQAVLAMSSDAPFPQDQSSIPAALYRSSTIQCDRVQGQSAIAGHRPDGERGWAQTASCITPQGEVDVALGWTRAPNGPRWTGGTVGGLIVPAGKGVRLQADPPVAGLEPLGRPDPNDIPNNHFAYAIQWFLFAATALVIYAIALRKRLKG
jgi:surfeit locus 1 family protein